MNLKKVSIVNNINELKELCISKNIPIIRDDIALFFQDFFKQEWIKNVLEIGTAYGYSSYIIHNSNANIKITTIEKNIECIKIAQKYISNFANIINIDVREFHSSEKFDVIFFDGPKTCQMEMFDNLRNNLSENGIILIDNIYLRDLANKSQSYRVKKILDKNNKFVEYVKCLEEWTLDIYDIGDGLGVLKRCKN